MQSCLEPHGKYCIGFAAVQCFPKSIKTKLHRIFYAMLSVTTRQYCTGFWPVQCYPKSIKKTLQRIFSYTKFSGASRIQCCLEPFRQHCIGFWPMQCCPKRIKTKLQTIFFMQCFLEPLGQHCIGFLTGKYCPRSIKTTLNRIFSYAMLSVATQTKLRKVLTCAILSQEY